MSSVREILPVPPSIQAILDQPLDVISRGFCLAEEARRLGVEVVMEPDAEKRGYGRVLGVRPLDAMPPTVAKPVTLTEPAGRVIAEHADGTVSVRLGPEGLRSGSLSPDLQQKVADLHLTVAKNRIAELETALTTERECGDRARRRANMLSDKCGELDTENRALLAENARLRRKLERRR